jgi:formylglycine-generating enzyme required for sulfatase activity
MAYVPGGGPDGVAPFWMGRHEVTWDEFELYFLTPQTEADAVARPSPPYEPPDWGMGRGRRPATSLRRQAAQRYCEWLSNRAGKVFRLPTEAEWGHAVRSGGPQNPLEEFAWFAANSGGKSQEVGGKKANALGIHDLLGNVWEYCSDPFTPGKGDPVLRGGAWNSPAEEVDPARRQPEREEWSERDPQRPKSSWWYTDGHVVGFRLVRSAEEGPGR